MLSWHILQVHVSWYIKWPDELNPNIIIYILFMHGRKGNLNIFQMRYFCLFYSLYIISIQDKDSNIFFHKIWGFFHSHLSG